MTRFAARVLLIGLVGASSVAAQDLSCRTGDMEVRFVEFRGNNAISDGDLEVQVVTTPTSWMRRHIKIAGGPRRCLNRNYLPRDLQRVQRYYELRGYSYAKVDTVVQAVGRNAVGVIFTIVEGAPTILTSVGVTGLSGVRDSAGIVNSLRLRAGRPFDQSLYFADVDSITRRLRNGGYFRADVPLSYKRDTTTARVEFPVIPGTRAKFGVPQISVSPAEGRGQQLSDNVVRRVMGIEAGAWFSDKAIIEAQRGLFQLGTYRHVEVAPLPDSLQPIGDSIVVLDVRLTEDYTHLLDSEYGWATLDCGRVRMQYTDLNFLRTARRLEVSGQASKIGYGAPLATGGSRSFCTFNGNSPLTEDPFSDSLHYYAGFSLRQPRFLGTRWVPALSVYSERRGEYKAYLRTTKGGADISATREIADRTQLRIGYSVEYGRTEAPEALLCAIFGRCDDASRANIRRLATLGVASASIGRQRTDNIVSPTRGTVMRAEVRSAAAFLGTSDSLFFNKGSAEFAWYTPFGGGNVLSLRVRTGAVVAAAGSAFIPPQERLYAGGATSVRGFQQNELGDAVYIASAIDTLPSFQYEILPGVSFERVHPLGGNTLLVANIEYRVRDPFFLPNLLQYSFFIDGGDVWNRPKTPLMKWTPGIGLRLITPIGPFQMNVGYNPYQRPVGPIYYEDASLSGQPISPLYCVSPGNGIELTVVNGVRQAPPGSVCPATFSPIAKTRFLQRLAFTFSIGPDF